MAQTFSVISNKCHLNADCLIPSDLLHINLKTWTFLVIFSDAFTYEIKISFNRITFYCEVRLKLHAVKKQESCL